MNEPGPVTSHDSHASRAVFVSFSSADADNALHLCSALESRGIQCWISCREVAPGENYQEAIVRAIKGARAMVLVFSEAANRSDEIKKELSLASRHRIPVIAARIENVEPTDAFAYELSTRQWIDAFKGWDKSIDVLAQRLAQRSAGPAASLPTRARTRSAFASPTFVVAATLVIIVIASLAAWMLMRPGGRSPQPLEMRLAGFQRLSDDIPAAMPDTMREEMIAAFGDDGIVRVSTASLPPAGAGAAYALGGSIRRDGDQIKVIAQITNEHSGTTLWSNSYVYDATQADRLPRLVAVSASMLARCGLFGVSTYPSALPESVLADYFQTCQYLGDEPDKALDFGRKVVAAAPDFSWGWSAIEIADFNAILARPPQDRAAQLRQEGLQAADRALKLDRTNSEALTYKSELVDEGDLIGREKLLKQAIHARTLPCGCEHHFYGDFLMEVGRINDAVAEYRRAIDIMALNSNSQLSLAQAYFAIRRPDLAKPPLASAIELDGSPNFRQLLNVSLAPITGDYRAGLAAVNDPQYGAPPPIRPILSAAFRALISNDLRAKASAAQELEAMPAARGGALSANLLGALGANRAALETIVAASIDGKHHGARSWFFNPNTAGVVRDPTFPGAAQRLGLMRYWKTTHTKPDVCSATDPPAFCRMI
jgi:tetratricopeptide (TPR) repeat protein